VSFEVGVPAFFFSKQFWSSSFCKMAFHSSGVVETACPFFFLVAGFLTFLRLMRIAVFVISFPRKPPVGLDVLGLYLTFCGGNELFSRVRLSPAGLLSPLVAKRPPSEDAVSLVEQLPLPRYKSFGVFSIWRLLFALFPVC